jgi:flagellar FliL protein
MTDAAINPPEEGAKKSNMPMIVGVFLMVFGGGGGFFAVSSGLVSLSESHEPVPAEESADKLPDITYVPVDPLVVSLTENGQMQHLRFRAQLEVGKKYRADVELLLPRIVDVLNGYLRALELSDLKDPLALTRLRAQMLRRIQIVVGEGRVRDLLIMEFVLT